MLLKGKRRLTIAVSTVISLLLLFWLKTPSIKGDPQAVSEKTAIYNAGNSLSRIKCLVLIPGSDFLITGQINGSVKLWDLEKQKLVKELLRADDAVISLSISPNKKRLAIGLYNNTTILLDIDSKETFAKLKDFGSEVVFSPDGKYVAGAGNGVGINLADTQKGHLLKKMKNSTGYYSAITFSYDCRKLITGRYDGRVDIWNVGTGKPEQTLTGHKWQVHVVAFSKDNKRVLTGGYTMKSSVRWETIRDSVKNPGVKKPKHGSWALGNTLLIWDLKKGRIVTRLPQPHRTLAAVFLDEKRVASCGMDNLVRIWNTDTGDCIRIMHVGRNLYLNCMAFSKKRNLIFTAGGDGVVYFIDADLGRIKGRLTAYQPPFVFLGFSKELMISVDAEGRIVGRSIGKGSKMLYSKDLQGTVTACCLSPDGKILAVCKSPGRILFFNAGNGLKTGEFSICRQISFIEWSPDGEFLFIGSRNSELMKLDVGKKALQWKTSLKTGAVTSMEYDVTNHRLVCGTLNRWKGNLVVLDPGDGSIIKGIDGEGHPAFSIAILKNGRYAVTSGKKIRIVDPKTGQAVYHIGPEHSALWTLAYNDEANVLAASGRDGRISLYRPVANKFGMIGTLDGRGGDVYCLAFSINGSHLASAGKDHHIKVWGIKEMKMHQALEN